LKPDVADWNVRPYEAFEAFLRSEEFVATGRERKSGFERRFVQAETARVYLSMFRQFAKWLDARDQPFTSLSTADVTDFYRVVRLTASSTLAMRYLRMLERCYIHLKINNPNPAGAAAKIAPRSDELKPADQATTVLSTAAVDEFVKAAPVHKARYRQHPKRGLEAPA
jgi:hypothetical protein